jgi:hypothetical protein
LHFILGPYFVRVFFTWAKLMSYPVWNRTLFVQVQSLRAYQFISRCLWGQRQFLLSFSFVLVLDMLLFHVGGIWSLAGEET